MPVLQSTASLFWAYSVCNSGMFGCKPKRRLWLGALICNKLACGMPNPPLVVWPRTADGLSTALCIVPPARADALVAAHPGVRAWFVDGRSRVTARDT